MIVSALVVALVVPPTAQGGGNASSGVAGIVHIRNKPPYFHGNIGAENEICSSPRTIKLFERKKNGDRDLLGTTVSEFKPGVKAPWEILVEDPEPGSYFAASPKQTMENGGFPVDCARAKSRTITLD